MSQHTSDALGCGQRAMLAGPDRVMGFGFQAASLLNSLACEIAARAQGFFKPAQPPFLIKQKTAGLFGKQGVPEIERYCSQSQSAQSFPFSLQGKLFLARRSILIIDSLRKQIGISESNERRNL
jgi:hypothetical protein